MPPPTETLIRARGLAVGYGGRAVQEGLDFEVRRGEVFLVLGGSGCGKSTLLRTLAGLQPPVSGEVELLLPPVDDGAGREAPPPFGVLFQSGALFGSMSVADNVALPLRRWTRLEEQAIEVIVRWKLRLVGLDGFENHLPSELSGGMRKRAGIARALALESELLFLDEPTSGLDPVNAAEIDDLVLTLKESLGVTLVIVTHELQSIFNVGERCILLDRDARGEIARGDPRELRDHAEDPRVRAFFHRIGNGDQ